jgi:uncharacterized ferritin-like protein (DUF455 family)
MKDGGDFNLRVFDRAELGGEDKKSRMLGSNQWFRHCKRSQKSPVSTFDDVVRAYFEMSER